MKNILDLTVKLRDTCHDLKTGKVDKIKAQGLCDIAEVIIKLSILQLNYKVNLKPKGIIDEFLEGEDDFIN